MLFTKWMTLLFSDLGSNIISSYKLSQNFILDNIFQMFHKNFVFSSHTITNVLDEIFSECQFLSRFHIFHIDSYFFSLLPVSGIY